MAKPKLNRSLVTKELIELERRLGVVTGEQFAMGDTILIQPCRQASGDHKLTADHVLYSSISHMAKSENAPAVFVINHQIEARAIIPNDPLYSVENNETILEAVGNLLADKLKFSDNVAITEWLVEEDFILNKTNPDYTGSVLSVKLFVKDDNVSNVVKFITSLRDLPIVEMEISETSN